MVDDLVEENLHLPVQVYHDMLRRYVSVRRMDPDDAIQTGYVALCRAAQKWDGTGSFQAYAYQAIKNEIAQTTTSTTIKTPCARFWSKRWQDPKKYRPETVKQAEQTRRIDNIQPDHQPTPNNPCSSVTDDYILRILSQLSQEERDIIQMRYYQDLSNDEIAREFEVVPTYVSKLHAQAMMKLRMLLGEPAELSGAGA
jgi:RNA polymerase sigma factor (sigma-70 family)